MSDFVKVIVNDFSKINQHVLLDLNFSAFVNLYSRSMNNTQITDEVFSILSNNHKLWFPEFFVIWDLVVISITFSNFENSKVSIKSNCKIFYFFSVDSLKI